MKSSSWKRQPARSAQGACSMAVEGLHLRPAHRLALPGLLHPKDEMELIRPARDGALRVLKAAKAAGVQRVVMTSSMASIAYGHGDRRAEISDETMWSDLASGPDNTPYTKSKTIAERAAWDYINGEGKGLQLAVINPTGILGPASVGGRFDLARDPIASSPDGKTPGLPANSGFHLRTSCDVAECHVKAMELPGAAGERFLATHDFMWFAEAAEVLALGSSWPTARRYRPGRCPTLP